MRKIASLFAALVLSLSPAAQAQEVGKSPVVVELFTSQGCSSCPPADALMHELVKLGDVIALSVHVDYWDYIGWKDAFADPAHTARQKAYAHLGGRNMVYTPQMIVNGVADVVGAKPMELANVINRFATQPASAQLQVTRQGGVVQIEATRTDYTPAGPMVVQMVQFDAQRRVQITRGENAGRDMTYVNVVDGWQTLGEWRADTPLSLTASIPVEGSAAILIQEPGPGRIIAAARLD